MNEPPLTPEASHDQDDADVARSWLAPLLLAAGIVLTIGAIGVVFVLEEATNQRIMKQIAELQAAQKEVHTLGDDQAAALQAIPALKEAVDTMSATSLKIEALTQSNTQTSEQIAALSARLDALEKSITAPAIKQEKSDVDTLVDLKKFLALKAAILAGEPFAEKMERLRYRMDVMRLMKPLADAAEEGIKTETALRSELVKALLGMSKNSKEKSKEAAAPHSLIARLNRQFDGMLHITQHTENDDPYAQLRVHAEAKAPLATLIDDARALPSKERAPLADWITSVELQQKAEAILVEAEAVLTTQDHTP